MFNRILCIFWWLLSLVFSVEAVIANCHNNDGDARFCCTAMLLCLLLASSEK